MSQRARVPLTCLLILAATPMAVAADDDKTAMARKAQEILKAHCARCHGNGMAEGGFNYVMDRAKLIDRRKIVPKDPDKSRLYKLIAAGDMPPEGEKPRPAPPDVALIKQWIAAGAADAKPVVVARTFISPGDAYLAMQENLKRTSQRERRFKRFFTLTHLYNAGVSEDELQTYRLGLAKLVNSLSWGKKIVVPQPIDPARTILRIDLRDYKWNPKIWDQILARNPYGVLYNLEPAHFCYAQTQARIPDVRGDWFVEAASRPPLYHDVLQMPKTDAELEKTLHVDVTENVHQERVARAGFNGSGVSRSNRLIERHESVYGAYWKSYDFADSSSQKNLFDHPLGPGGKNSFKQDGGELIFNLPNGLQAYMLINAEGKRIDKGPTNIVLDKKQGDAAVVNGISCMSCHAKGMIEKADQVRDSVLANAQAFGFQERGKILALYPPHKKFLTFLEEDAQRFKEAVTQTGGQVSTAKDPVEPIVTLALDFEAEMDLSRTAAELGLRVEEFRTKLHHVTPGPAARINRILGPVLVRGGTIQRPTFDKEFGAVVRELDLGTYVERPTVEIIATTPQPPLKPADKPPEGKIKEIKGTIAKIEPAKYLISVKTSEGKEQRFRVSGETKFLNPQGKELPQGLADKHFKEGSPVTIIMDPAGKRVKEVRAVRPVPKTAASK